MAEVPNNLVNLCGGKFVRNLVGELVDENRRRYEGLHSCSCDPVSSAMMQLTDNRGAVRLNCVG
jgi:hypothetical protein